MISSPERTDISAYMEALAAHLSDLPQAERDELMEDLEQHLAEVAGEAEGDLEEKLGTPEAYAEELRTSAGIPPRDAIDDSVTAKILASAPARWITSLGSQPVVRSARAFGAELRPGWWVLRAYLVVEGMGMYPFSYLSRENFPVPSIAGSQLVGALALVLAIWLSIRIGRNTQHRTVRWLGYGFSVVAIVLAWDAVTNFRYGMSQGSDVTYVPASAAYLHHGDETRISNICPYGVDGTLLEGVLLFDQDGRAIVDLARETEEGFPIRRATPAIPNAYPQDLTAETPPWIEGSDGEMSAQIRPLRCAPAVRAPAPRDLPRTPEP